MNVRTLIRRSRRHPIDRTDTIQLQIKAGDVADILPADILPARSVEADKAELTRIISSWASAGSIDRATGGHKLDGLVRAWHADYLADVRAVFHNRDATADRLIGSAEAGERRRRVSTPR